jgi:hypothetical protein
MKGFSAIMFLQFENPTNSLDFRTFPFFSMLYCDLKSRLFCPVFRSWSPFENRTSKSLVSIQMTGIQRFSDFCMKLTLKGKFWVEDQPYNFLISNWEGDFYKEYLVITSSHQIRYKFIVKLCIHKGHDKLPPSSYLNCFTIPNWEWPLTSLRHSVKSDINIVQPISYLYVHLISTVVNNFSEHPKAWLSGFWMVISRTLFVSGIQMFGLDHFYKIFFMTLINKMV